MITVVITSCNRIDLLKITVESFLKYNTYPITEFIIVDDSGNADVHDQIRGLYSDWTLILEPQHQGQIQSIDAAYALVRTPYIFHCEDDWEFFNPGFMEESLAILEQDKRVQLAWILHPEFPVEPQLFKAGDVEYHLLGNDDSNAWHGFTWNPSLRRLSDYKLVAPYSSFIEEGDFNALTECRIGHRLYEEFGFKAAILNGSYCKHIGTNKAIPC